MGNTGGRSSINELELGLALLFVVLIGSLWGCIGFIMELAAIDAGLSLSMAQGFFKAIGVATLCMVSAFFVHGLARSRDWRRDGIIGALIYGLLLVATPRSFTFDTGLYHVPLINHLQQIGLEWNLGWLHSRYGFFNLLLYGQAALARILGVIQLPSLNGICLVATLLFLRNCIKRDWHRLSACIALTGAMLIPSESTESFHSFNADFSLACVFVVACLLAKTDNQNNDALTRSAALAIFMPAIKLSGLLLLPIVLAGWTRGYRNSLFGRGLLSLLPLITVVMIAAGSFGFITTGYAAYPISWTGPLRAESIKRITVDMESKASTLAWARYAYSGQLDALKVNAAPQEWLPKWSKSLNGKRMLGYLAVAILTTLSSFHIPRLKIWRAPLLALTVFWISTILIFPPDPRFYVGPVFLTIYLFATWVLKCDLFGVCNGKDGAMVYLASVVLIVMITAAWRKSEVDAWQFPDHTGGKLTESFTNKFYRSRGNKFIHKGEHALCWDITPPCMP